LDEPDLTGSKSCPWTAQRLYKTVPTELLYEQLGVLIPENKVANTFGPIECMRVLSSIEMHGQNYTREQLVEQYGEANVVMLDKHREESSKCMQVMTNEIISDPEAWNAECDDELLVSCNEPYPTMDHPPEMAAHFDELFASLASDPETAAKINGTIPITNRYCMSTSHASMAATQPSFTRMSTSHASTATTQSTSETLFTTLATDPETAAKMSRASKAQYDDGDE
jgi:hypothetical protein